MSLFYCKLNVHDLILQEQKKTHWFVPFLPETQRLNTIAHNFEPTEVRQPMAFYTSTDQFLSDLELQPVLNHLNF